MKWKATISSLSLANAAIDLANAIVLAGFKFTKIMK